MSRGEPRDTHAMAPAGGISSRQAELDRFDAIAEFKVRHGGILAELRRQGVDHPEAAAAALAARGVSGLGVGDWAEHLRLDLRDVADVESGRRPVGDAPPPLRRRMLMVSADLRRHVTA